MSFRLGYSALGLALAIAALTGALSSHGEDSVALGEQPTWKSDFSSGGAKAWRPFGEAGDIKTLLNGSISIGTREDPERGSPVLKIEFTDKSPTDWFHKGAKVTFPSPIAWKDFNFVSCWYKTDAPIISIGYYLKDENGVWWESFQSRDLVKGKWALSVVSKATFRVGELSYRQNPTIKATKDARVCELFVYVGSISANRD